MIHVRSYCTVMFINIAVTSWCHKWLPSDKKVTELPTLITLQIWQITTNAEVVVIDLIVDCNYVMILATQFVTWLKVFWGKRTYSLDRHLRKLGHCFFVDYPLYVDYKEGSSSIAIRSDRVTRNISSEIVCVVSNTAGTLFKSARLNVYSE